MLKLKSRKGTESIRESLVTKYRPSEWNQVIGQEAVVNSIRKAFKSGKLPHAFLLTGPSGTGKTTIARLIAKEFGVEERSVIQVDAASYSGVDDVRAITGNLMYRGLGENPVRFIIIDECHALSKSAWQALLLALEEPPEHVYWALCTTEPDKVPKTIQTRCYSYALKLVDWSTIHDLLERIVEREELEIGDKVLTLIARRADGSPRQAISYLGMCAGAKDLEEVRSLINSAEASVPAIELARLISKGQGMTWESVRGIINRLEDTNLEGVRLVIVNYAAKAMLDVKGEKEAIRYANILGAFSRPYNPSEGRGPLLLSLSELLFN